jgi:hypothetical protein
MRSEEPAVLGFQGRGGWPPNGMLHASGFSRPGRAGSARCPPRRPAGWSGEHYGAGSSQKHLAWDAARVEFSTCAIPVAAADDAPTEPQHESTMPTSFTCGKTLPAIWAATDNRFRSQAVGLAQIRTTWEVTRDLAASRTGAAGRPSHLLQGNLIPPAARWLGASDSSVPSRNVWGPLYPEEESARNWNWPPPGSPKKLKKQNVPIAPLPLSLANTRWRSIRSGRNTCAFEYMRTKHSTLRR